VLVGFHRCESSPKAADLPRLQGSDVCPVQKTGKTRIRIQISHRLSVLHFFYIIPFQWEKQHEGLSCEMFQEWKEANDAEYQAEGYI